MRTDPRPRRLPHRRHGAEVLTAVLDATERLLEEAPIESITTKKIAARADVSIGSVYRYFRDLEGVIAEVGRRHEARYLAAVREAHEGLAELGADATLRRLFRSYFTHELASVGVRRALRAHLPRAWIAEQTERMYAALLDLLAAMKHTVPAMDRPDAALRARLSMHALEGVLNAALLRTPGLLDEAALESELYDLVWPFLTASSASRNAAVPPNT